MSFDYVFYPTQRHHISDACLSSISYNLSSHPLYFFLYIITSHSDCKAIIITIIMISPAADYQVIFYRLFNCPLCGDEIDPEKPNQVK